MKSSRFKIIVYALGALGGGLLLWVAPAFARAGGGGGYSGGGGSFGGGSGGGDGLGTLVYLLLRLCIAYPAIGIPLTLLIIIIAIVGAQQGWWTHQQRTIRRATTARDIQRAAKGVDELKQRDPAFQPRSFLQRVRRAFINSQNAWCKQKLEPIRPFVSDSIHERWSLQLQEQKDLGYRDQMDELEILNLQIVQVIQDPPFDVMTVRIRAAAMDYRITIGDGKKASGSKRKDEFVEFWSFIRRRNATTKPEQPGLMEGNCPNCGAAIELNQAAKCKYCGALLRSGEYDWVLAEITQAGEWTGSAPERVRGFREVKKQDPELNLQALEDRASVMFWRRAMADRLGKIEPLKRIASPAFSERYAQILMEDAKSKDGRIYYGERAVGAVNTIGVMIDGEWTRALVEVRWSGSRFRVLPTGKRQDTGQKSVFRGLLVLVRKAQARSESNASVSSAHCPNCGAPEEGGTSGSCDYCGTVLNDGSKDWILEDAPAWAEHRAQALIRQIREQSATAPTAVAPSSAAHAHVTSAGVLAWMIQVMYADGRIDEKERKLLDQVASHRRIPTAQIETMINACRNGTMDIPQPSDQKEAREWLAAMVSMALADGSIDASEKQILRDCANSLEMSPYDLKMMIRRERARLYKESQEALRAQKRAKLRENDFKF